MHLKGYGEERFRLRYLEGKGPGAEESYMFQELKEDVVIGFSEEGVR